MKKNKTFLRKIALVGAVVGFSVFLSSCSDDDETQDGTSLNVKVVNVAENSGNQDFYIGDSKITSVSANSESSNYIATPASGNNRKVEFRTVGSSDVYASKEFDLKDNKNYTFILSGTGSSASILGMEDDLSAPASGKAKVRFVHLSTASAASSNVDFSLANGTKLASNIEYGKASNFVEVDAGLTALTVTPVNNPESRISLNIAALAANRIYTVIVKGSTEVSTMLVTNK